MQTTWQQTHWLNDKPQYRRIISYVVSAMIIALILLIPISLHYDFSQSENSIEVILSKENIPIEPEQKPVVQQQKIKQEIVEKPAVEPIVQKKQQLLLFSFHLYLLEVI